MKVPPRSAAERRTAHSLAARTLIATPTASTRQAIAKLRPSPKRRAIQYHNATDGAAVRPTTGQTSDSTGLQSALVTSDLELVRVLEDLITALIDKRIIMLTDLPKAAQQKLAHRYDLRSQLADLGGIVAEQEDIPLP